MAISAVSRAADAGLIFVADVIAAPLRARTAVVGTTLTGLAQKRLARTVAAAIAAVFRTGFAIFFAMTLSVATNRHNLADAAFEFGDLSHAETIPGYFAAEGVGGADAGLSLLVETARSRVILTAIAIA